MSGIVRAKVTSKGQITLPVELRRKYGIATGDDVEFRMNESGAVMVPLRKRSLTEFYGTLHSKKPFVGRAAERQAVGRYLARRYRSGR